MIYLISGSSRSGKTMIAEQISQQKKISYLSLDWLVMGFTNGIPEYGIHDLLQPDEIASRSWDFFKAMFESILFNDIDYIIEGEALLPNHISVFMKKHPSKIKVCFLGYTDVIVEEKLKEIKEFSLKKGDWLKDKSDEYIVDHINNMVKHSKKIKKSCAKSDLRYFDTSKNFNKVIEDAIDYMMI